MGFEYKISGNLTDKQTIEIKYLLENIKIFDKKYEFNNKMFWEFRNSNNSGKMPNINICFENDGIYICKYSSSHLWTELEELKAYIQKENIRYRIIDYQD